MTTPKATMASIALATILAIYASGLAMTALTTPVPKAFASSSSDSSKLESGNNSSIDKSEERQILDGVKKCFDSSSDNSELEKCMNDTIEKIIRSNTSNSSSSQD
jgi:hypothetical protein